MRNEYDFTNAVKNPYIVKSERQIWINIDADIANYFIKKSKLTGVPYQILINRYLKAGITSNDV